MWMKVQWQVTVIRDGVEWQTISVQRQKSVQHENEAVDLSNCSSDEKSNKNFESERFTRSSLFKDLARGSDFILTNGLLFYTF